MVKNVELMAIYKAEHGIPNETELKTYASWKAEGYRVKKGETSKHKVGLWKHSSKIVEKNGKETISSRCYMHTCYLFEKSQVEKIK